MVGSGMGGSTLAWALSRPGRRIVVLEQGRDSGAPESLRGHTPETEPAYLSGESARTELLARSGRSAERLEDGERGDRFQPFVGCGTGGSSALFGMVMERRLPHDFAGWPMDATEMAPWYAQAESLFGVTVPAQLPPLSAANGKLFSHLERGGLRPRRLPLACRRIPGCRMCQGYLCDGPEPCKMDAGTACLGPARQRGDTEVWTGMRVLSVEYSGRRAIGVRAIHDGREVRLQARTVVLAAGALGSPHILMRSAGPCSRSPMLGRRLMRHVIDLFVLGLGPRYTDPAESKELGLHDFYLPPHGLGTVQSFGMAPPLEYLRSRPGPNLWRALGPAAAPVARLFRGVPVIAGILDDEPRMENGLELAENGLRYRYALSVRDVERRARLRRAILRAFARFVPVPVFGTSAREALGHVCGTAIFGEDPETSVLDRDNRVHGMENLYVVDGSFFPTSGGVNPALTIAANALRVAERIEQTL